MRNYAGNNPFKDPDGTYSVRKFGGYLALLLLAFLIVSFCIGNEFKIEVPTSYLISLDTIIVFYFFKNTLSTLRINSKENSGVVDNGSDTESGNGK